MTETRDDGARGSRPPHAGPAEPELASERGSTDRPAFAASYPRDPELDRLVAYFARGNHRAVRAGAEALASKTEDPEVAAAARDLRRRLEPDPIGRALFGATLALLIALTAWAIHRSREMRATPAPAPPPTTQIVK